MSSLRKLKLQPADGGAHVNHQRHNGENDIALHAWFFAHSERVYRWALYLGADSASAEEITQDVFITVHQKDKRPTSETVLLAWLFQITRRLVANYRRNSWVKRVLKLESSAMDLLNESLLEENGNGAHMRQVLAQLPLKWVEVLLLHDLEGYTRTEISKILGIAEGTVASRLRFARAGFIEKWTMDHSEDAHE